MQGELLIVQVCEFLDNGDGVHRFHAPSRYLSQLPGVVVVDCDVLHRLLPPLAEVADVLILTAFDSDLLPLLERRRVAGRVTVFEANDYFFDIQAWNPLTARWYDQDLRSSLLHGLVHCDGVQTSTRELARQWAKRTTRPIAVFENHMTDVPPLGPLPERPLTIGWGGSPGHFADWYRWTPVLQRWLDAHPNVRLSVMTNDFARPFLELPPERYLFTPFGSLADYLHFVRGLDIGLAPLLPTGYNRGRSDVKFLEYASQGVPGIYADLEPYRDTIQPGELGLLYRTEAEFVQCLDQLTADAGLRRKIREQAHAYVCRERRLEDRVGERLAFYLELLPDPPHGAVVSQPVLDAAVTDGRYLQLRRQQPEETLRVATSAAATRESVQALSQLVATDPRYLMALQHLGRMLNDLREHSAALKLLQQALPLNPLSARTLAEIGRAQYRLGDLPRARQTLQTAVTGNPCHLLGWQYLLRLLSLSKPVDGPAWAERAFQAFPTNLSLALLGARTYPPAQSLPVLRKYLEQFGTALADEERPAATAAFSAALQELAGPVLALPAALELVERACAVFPHSAKLADLLARALHMAGRVDESHHVFTRANELRLSAQTYQAEYPRGDGSIHYWQFAAHILEAEKP